MTQHLVQSILFLIIYLTIYKNEDENKDDRKSFSKYYIPSVEIKDFNVLIKGKSFFDAQ